ncbi:UDP-glucose 4-epimerase GalE [Sporosarcina sp. 179-K 3D1 HS]|uniref:UDP-glucose 4-epimerase GalE n=1 Tax=Sporosarcina sp. 179-K 3D1 HS TaxID=3232169 RepID=UPI0039A1D5F9
MILVVGGAGYIGSHFVEELVKYKDVIVLDNLSTGFRRLVNDKAVFIEGELGDPHLLRSIFTTYRIAAVVHFAAASLVGESVADPQKYYLNNVGATLNLLQAMLENQVKHIVFSSTAATYGTSNDGKITEMTAVRPINPYGRSKLVIEWILEDYHRSYGLNYIVLRYFNASGAHENGRIGEMHEPETHLIPIILQHLLGRMGSISVFGDDYPTRDGTCIRDYVHVTDLAKAHLASLEALLSGDVEKQIFNVGSGAGFSVREVIEICEWVAGRQAKVMMEEKRQGDPAYLVASNEKIKEWLGWSPTYKLPDIVRTAWKWHSRLADE